MRRQRLVSSTSLLATKRGYLDPKPDIQGGAFFTVDGDQLSLEARLSRADILCFRHGDKIGYHIIPSRSFEYFFGHARLNVLTGRFRISRHFLTFGLLSVSAVVDDGFFHLLADVAVPSELGLAESLASRLSEDGFFHLRTGAVVPSPPFLQALSAGTCRVRWCYWGFWLGFIRNEIRYSFSSFHALTMGVFSLGLIGTVGGSR